MLDFFAGSGTTGAVAGRLGRHFVMIDQNPDAISVMHQRYQHRLPDLKVAYLRSMPDGLETYQPLATSGR